MSQAEQPLISHLVELRTRLLRSITAILVVFLALIYFSNNIYDFVAQPLLSQLPEGTSMIATDVATPFLTPIKLTLVVSFFVAIPYLLYQAWAFIAPGLYQHERRLIMPLVVSSALLFYAGMAFAYYVVFPLVFGFFTSTAPCRGDGGDRHRQLSGLRTDPVLRVRGGVRNSGGHHTALLDRRDHTART